jgi:hypothetical protein
MRILHVEAFTQLLSELRRQPKTMLGKAKAPTDIKFA